MFGWLRRDRVPINEDVTLAPDKGSDVRATVATREGLVIVTVSETGKVHLSTRPAGSKKNRRVVRGRISTL